MKTIAGIILFMAACVALTFTIVTGMEIAQVMKQGGCIPYEGALDLFKSAGAGIVSWVLFQVTQKD